MGNRSRQLDLSAAMLAAVVLSACAAAAQVPVAELADLDSASPQRSSAVLTPERDTSGARGTRALATQDDLGRRADHHGGGPALAGGVDAMPQFGDRIAMVATASVGSCKIDLSILHLALPPPGSR